jgi:hypothetical protein
MRGDRHQLLDLTLAYGRPPESADAWSADDIVCAERNKPSTARCAPASKNAALAGLTIGAGRIRDDRSHMMQ